MKTIEDARELSRLMVGIGKQVGRKVVAFITDMSQPLGYAIGNKLEVVEAVETLLGNGPEDLRELCIQIGSHMVHQGGVTKTLEEARKTIENALSSKDAYNKQMELFTRQGGKLPSLDEFINVKEKIVIRAKQSGNVKTIHALDLGLAAMKLGAGRATKEDTIDPDVGLLLHVKVGDTVKKGDPLVTVFNNKDDIAAILKEVEDAFELTDEQVDKQPLIYDIIT